MKTKNTVFLAIIAFCIASIGVSDELIDLDTKTLLQEIDANLDVIEAEEPAAASDNRSSVIGLQNELNRLGCNAGPVDGILGALPEPHLPLSSSQLVRRLMNRKCSLKNSMSI